MNFLAGRQPSDAKVEMLEKIIIKVQQDYNTKIKEILEIQDVDYKIITQDLPRESGGYVKERTNASAIPNKEATQIESVIFYTENIRQNINLKFSKFTDKDIFEEIVETYIKYMFIHELVHVSQIKNGMTLEQYRATKYEDSPYEKEANDKATEFLKEDCSLFHSEIVDLISGSNKRQMDNEYVTQLVILFQERS